MASVSKINASSISKFCHPVANLRSRIGGGRVAAHPNAIGLGWVRIEKIPAGNDSGFGSGLHRCKRWQRWLRTSWRSTGGTGTATTVLTGIGNVQGQSSACAGGDCGFGCIANNSGRGGNATASTTVTSGAGEANASSTENGSAGGGTASSLRAACQLPPAADMPISLRHPRACQVRASHTSSPVRSNTAKPAVSFRTSWSEMAWRFTRRRRLRPGKGWRPPPTAAPPEPLTTCRHAPQECRAPPSRLQWPAVTHCPPPRSCTDALAELPLWGFCSPSFLATQCWCSHSAPEEFPYSSRPIRHSRLESKVIDRGEFIGMQIELQTLRPVPFSQPHGSLPSSWPGSWSRLAVTRQAFCLRSHHHVKGKPPFWFSVLLDPRCGSTHFHLGSGALSRLRSASTILSNPTGCFAPGGSRMASCDSTAQESDAQDDRIARFSSVVRSGSLTTSCGWSNADAGWRRESNSGSISDHNGASRMCLISGLHHCRSASAPRARI
jgi:hypothetical protein